MRFSIQGSDMKKEVIVKLHGSFEELAKRDEQGVEYWLARDLQELLGYSKWENFSKVVDKAKISCRNSGYPQEDHFLDIRKMVEVGSGAVRKIDDIELTRYACYLIAQNGDPGKEADSLCSNILRCSNAEARGHRATAYGG
jgi:DNA-damage-inducible protein D